MHMPPEVVGQLLDPGPKFSSFIFVFWQIRCSEPFCTTVVWPMMMEAFVVMFSGKSVYVSRRLMAIEPMATLNRLLVCKLVHNAEWRDESFIIFLHQRFWSSYVSSCHGSNLYQTIKSGTLSKSSTIRFRMIYQLYSNHTYSSRYNGFLSARFLTPCTFCRYSLQYFILKAWKHSD